jgi:uncharacterized OB-fold protein
MADGWICPKCKRVLAPWVSECNYCNKSQSTISHDGRTTAGPSRTITYNPYDLVQEVPENPNHYASISLDGNQQCVDCRWGVPVSSPDKMATSIECDIFHVMRSVQDTCIAGRVDLTTMTAGGQEGGDI